VTNLFRIHIRPKGGNPDMHATFQHCLDHGVLGVGWRVDGLANTQDWAEYELVANSVHDSIAQPRYIATHVCPGALVWTRDPDARYYLARVQSGWEYWTSPEAAAMDIDIANIFRCEDFCEVDLDQVPGTVVSSFGLRGKSMQRIADRSALVYSQALWNGWAVERVYDVDRTQFPDIFAMLDPEETEDLVFMYLPESRLVRRPELAQGQYDALRVHACVLPNRGEGTGPGHDRQGSAEHRRLRRRSVADFPLPGE